MKIAITGATGFIGRHVLEELGKHAVDVVSAGRHSPQPGDTGTFRHCSVDLNDYSADLYRELGCPDVLIHLAWSGLDDFASPLHVERELPLHEAFLKDMLAAGLPSLLVTGTCLEYGLQTGCLAETTDTKPVTAYAKAKDRLRQRLQRYKNEHPFNLCWSRVFYPYGDGQARNSLLPQLRRAIESGDKRFNMSEGDQLRDFIPVESVAAIIAKLALADQDVGVINVCSGKPVSVMQQVRYWLAQYDGSLDLNPGYYDYPEYEPKSFWGDRTKLDRVLNGLS